MEYVFEDRMGVLTARKKESIGKPEKIRFIDSAYKTLFEIPDGGYVLIKLRNGDRTAYQCKYLDDYHFAAGDSVFHICQFAELMERIGAVYAPCPGKHILWSDIGLDLKDWIDDLKAEYPEADEEELIRRMYETNSFYFDDERTCLNTPAGGPILVIASLGLWNGVKQGYREIKNAVLSDCLDFRWDRAEWSVSMDGEFSSRQIHHDGENRYVYRRYRKGTTERMKDCLKKKLASGIASREDIDAVTEKLGHAVAAVCGWELPDRIVALAGR